MVSLIDIMLSRILLTRYRDETWYGATSGGRGSRRHGDILEGRQSVDAPRCSTLLQHG